MAAGRWSQQYGQAVGFATLAAIVVLDVILDTVVISASYAVAAVVAGAMTTVRRTAVVAVVAVPSRSCPGPGTRTSAPWTG